MGKKDVNPTDYDCIPAYADEKGGCLNAVIETPAHVRNKYAFEPKFGIMVLKMTLAEGLAWPYDYGFIPRTLAQDGDPIDVLVLNDEPTFPGCLVEVRLLGAIELKKNGVENDRLIGCRRRVPGVSLKTDEYRKLSDVPQDMLEGIERFLVEYSAEEGNTIELRGVCSRKKAYAKVAAAHKEFRKRS